VVYKRTNPVLFGTRLPGELGQETFQELDQFKFQEGTGVKASCSALWKGQMLIFGGGGFGVRYPDYSKQISQIGNCEMKRIGTLPFNFAFGGCTNLNEANGEFILLCFRENQRKSCFR